MTARPDRRSPQAAEWRKLYRTKAWQALRLQAFTRDLGICGICKKIIIGRYDADHIQPHKGDGAKFFDPGNVQVLHPDCHASLKQSREKHGYSSEIGPDGWPLDPAHPANRSHHK